MRITFATRVALGATALLIGLAVPGCAQGGGDEKNLEAEIEALKAGQKQIQRDLQEIKALLRSRPAAPQPQAPRNVVLDVAGLPSRGNADARVTMVEFSDFQCPYCGRHVRDTLPQIEESYVETGKVRYVLNDFPLRIHPQAPKAAEAARCAGDQGKYWEMHHKLFENQRALQVTQLVGYAAELGLDRAAFESCLNDGKYSQAVEGSVAAGSRAGISATPMFLIGYTDPESSKVKVVQQIRGAQPFASFQSVLDGMLADEGGDGGDGDDAGE